MTGKTDPRFVTTAQAWLAFAIAILGLLTTVGLPIIVAWADLRDLKNGYSSLRSSDQKRNEESRANAERMIRVETDIGYIRAAITRIDARLDGKR